MKTTKGFTFRILTIGLALVFASFNFSNAQNKTQQLDELIQKYSDYGQFNGSVLVAEKGKVIYKKGFGLANMEWNIPNQANTIHRLGSISKQFTSMLIVQLAAEGKLDLQASISEYIKEYPKANGEKITIHHLLTHTSGTPNYTAFPNFFRDSSRDPYSPLEFVETFADSSLEFTPGERFAYSNSGYFLLGTIIEQVTGKSYEEVLKERIFTPLKMNNSGYDHHATILPNRASGYEKNGSAYENAAYLDMSIPYAAGSLYSTVEDLYLWDQALYSEKLLPKKYMDMMFEAHIPAFGRDYGYGWGVGNIPVGNSTDSLYTIGHGGGINGFNTLITRIPSDKSLIVLLNNTSRAPLNDMTVAITGILHGKSYDFPKQSIANTLLNVILEQGIENGLDYYTKVKESENYYLNENEMNRIGYELLGDEKLVEAAEIFKLNMDAFPESFNVYDSYAESQMLLDENDEAIKYYKKSVAINPANQNGIDMLIKLGIDTENLIEEVEVPIEIMEKYVGNYDLMPGFMLTISLDGNQLKAQATGQPQFEIFPRSENVFYLKVITAQLTFNKNDQGMIESVTLLQGGQNITGKKMLE